MASEYLSIKPVTVVEKATLNLKSKVSNRHSFIKETLTLPK